MILDLSIICDSSKLHDMGCVCAPDLVVEILSKGTAAKDRTVKLQRYWATEVKETGLSIRI
ncbi:Uma2 family endonuclease [Alicyclobacillus fodiniaquatilis]|uniref:Uma2 family endonuclease n=1 Tax=Alicyclobacillus fodiniaquatilis TaxID=1661150 RepID=A0ABW4JEC7_9BACL